MKALKCSTSCEKGGGTPGTRRREDGAAGPDEGATGIVKPRAKGAGAVGTKREVVETAGDKRGAAGVAGNNESVESFARAVTKLSAIDGGVETSVLGERRKGGDESSSLKAGTGTGGAKVVGPDVVGAGAGKTKAKERDEAAVGAAEVVGRAVTAAELGSVEVVAAGK